MSIVLEEEVLLSAEDVRKSLSITMSELRWLLERGEMKGDLDRGIPRSALEKAGMRPVKLEDINKVIEEILKLKRAILGVEKDEKSESNGRVCSISID